MNRIGVNIGLRKAGGGIPLGIKNDFLRVRVARASSLIAKMRDGFPEFFKFCVGLQWVWRIGLGDYTYCGPPWSASLKYK